MQLPAVFVLPRKLVIACLIIVPKPPVRKHSMQFKDLDVLSRRFSLPLIRFLVFLVIFRKHNYFINSPRCSFLFISPSFLLHFLDLIRGVLVSYTNRPRKYICLIAKCYGLPRHYLRAHITRIFYQDTTEIYISFASFIYESIYFILCRKTLMEFLYEKRLPITFRIINIKLDIFNVKTFRAIPETEDRQGDILSRVVVCLATYQLPVFIKNCLADVIPHTPIPTINNRNIKSKCRLFLGNIFVYIFFLLVFHYIGKFPLYSVPISSRNAEKKNI